MLKEILFIISVKINVSCPVGVKNLIDVVWVKLDVHFVVKQSKTMQGMGEFQGIQLPKLEDTLICLS